MISVDTLTELAKKNAIGRSMTFLDGWVDGYWLLRLAIEVIKQDPLPYKNMDEYDHDKVQDIDFVRCKDCEYYMNDARQCWNELINADMIIEPDWFCANGVRKDYDACRN